jgi:hypothetical protein
MKKILWILLGCLVMGGAVYGQVEQGDSEVNSLGYYGTLVGQESASGGFGTVMFNYGYFITSHLQIGLGPQINFITSGDGKNRTKFSGTAFMNFNLSTASKTFLYQPNGTRLIQIPDNGVLRISRTSTSFGPAHTNEHLA